MVSFRLGTLAREAAHDAHDRTAGIAGRTQRRGGRVATRGARAAGERVRRIGVLMSRAAADVDGQV
jgi:hypothetical protein